MLPSCRAVLLFLCLAGLSAGHIGSPDVYLDGHAGPYRLFVTIRPPQVIPGVAEIEVRTGSSGVREMHAAALPLSRTVASSVPVPDQLRHSSGDMQFFSGPIWLMTDGSWQIRIQVDGSQGSGILAVPVPAIARATRSMQWQLGAVLGVMGLFLVGGLTAIIGAAVREAKLPQGVAPNARKGRWSMVIAFSLMVLVLWGGKAWWDSEVDVYRGRVYKPLNMQAALVDLSTLRLDLSEPGWMQPQPAKLTRVLFVRKMDDLVLDHGHLMHLYAIRQPGLDVIYHLHPDLIQPDQFNLQLPAMPPGNYKLYADIVHENGLPETLTAHLNLPHGITGPAARPLSGDDAYAETTPVDQAALGDTFTLPDGYRMRWLRAGTLHARQGTSFQFELLTPDGGKPKDMALYMGMLGHAAFVKTDGSVFAHIHPNGTVAMSAFLLAQNGAMDHSSMYMDDAAIPNAVGFPYGLPTPGKYRIYVQMKHGESVETGVFDATAD